VWSPAYQRALFLSGLEATERSAWPSPTRIFTSLAGVDFGTPIDHVAVSRGIAVAGFATGPDFGSDHRPVVADLKLP
jgi:endonuclease/exonuclease/phosphatase (EEP) superfamily protein YafD